jgi:hypothetical protein
MDAAKPLALIRVVGPGLVVGFRSSEFGCHRVLKTKSMVKPPTTHRPSVQDDRSKYADVSGVIACTSDRSKGPLLPLDVVHNHFAKVAIPRGFFGPGADEWVTEPDGKEGINVKKVARKAGAPAQGLTR